MNTETEPEVILNQDGEVTDLAVPSDFENGLAFLNPADMPDLDAAEVGVNITPESVEFKVPGEHIRAIFNGFKDLDVRDRVTGGYKKNRAAVLQTNNGIKINMGANLIKQLAFVPVGTAVLITYKGEEPTQSGNKVKVYDVNLLNVKRASVTTFARIKPPAPSRPAPAPEPTNGERVWSVSQKQVLVENGCAANTGNAKGMLDLSNLPDDATEAEIIKWGKAYRSHRDAMNPDTGESYTTADAALYANGDTELTSFPLAVHRGGCSQHPPR